MKYIIRGDNTQSIKEYIELKLDRLDKYFSEKEYEASVLTKKEGRMQKIEVTIPTDKFILRSEEKLPPNIPAMPKCRKDCR